MARPPIHLELEKDDVLLVVKHASEKADDHLEEIAMIDDLLNRRRNPLSERELMVSEPSLLKKHEQARTELRSRRSRLVSKFDRCQALIVTIEEQTL